MKMSQNIILIFHDLMIKSLKSLFDVQSELSLILLSWFFKHILELTIYKISVHLWLISIIVNILHAVVCSITIRLMKLCLLTGCDRKRTEINVILIFKRIFRGFLCEQNLPFPPPLEFSFHVHKNTQSVVNSPYASYATQKCPK